MVIFLLSLRCGHCVHRAVVAGTDEYYAVKRDAASRPCPLCGVRSTDDEFQVVTTSQDVRAIRDGALPWNRFAFAKAPRLRKSDYEVLSRAFQRMYGLRLGIEAFEAGNLTRALVWLELTVEVLKEPLDIAFAYGHIGMAHDRLGHVEAAGPAFRAAYRHAEDDPSLRATVAYNLGVYTEHAGRRREARALYAEAARSAPPEIAELARRRLSAQPR